MTRILETDLYAPIKTHFERLGFEVKSEIGDADVVACRVDEPPVIIEMKIGFSLILLQQAIARQTMTDHVYVAVPRWKGKAAWQKFKGNISLCKRLGLGVLSINIADQTVQVHHDPRPFTARKNATKRTRMQKEFDTREGDPNLGGMKAGGRVTSYRQDAEKCRAYLQKHGLTKGAVVARETGVKRATAIMRDNHYGWFKKISLGVYGIS